MNDIDRKKLDVVIELLQGLLMQGEGIRRHISSDADLREIVIKDVLKVVKQIQHNDDKDRKKRGQTWPGDSR